MNAISNTLAVAGKELQVLFKDRGNLVVLFLMPLLIASFISQIGRMVSPGEEAPEIKVHVYVVNQDAGPYGERVVDALRDIKVLAIRTLNTPEVADRQVADGKAAAAIIVPADFSQDINAYQPTQVQVIVDPVQTEAAGIVAGIMNQVVAEVNLWGEITYGIRAVLDKSGAMEGATAEMRRAVEAQTLGVIMTQLAEMRQSPAIAVRSEDLEGVEPREPVGPASFNMPSMTTMFAFFLVGIIATGILTEKENGTFRRLLASPIHPGSIIAGKMLAHMLIVILQALLMLGVGRIVFGMALGNSPLALLLLTLALALAATALGMVLATVARTSQQADSLGVIISLILAGISGCMPLTGVLFFREKGTFMYYLANLTPHGHALEGYVRLFFEGAGLAYVLPQIGVLTGMGVVFFLIAIWRFKFE